MQVGSTTNNVSFWVNPKATRHLTGGLPQSGGPNGRQQAAAATPPPKVIKDAMGTVIHAGTVVSFIKDADQVQRLQAGKRGWSDRLLPLLVTGRLPGLVTALKADGDIEVAALAFVADDRETVIVVNPSAVTVRSQKTILRGNTVTLLESETDFRALQQGHGSWTDDMSSFLGKPIVIQFFDRDGDIVAMMGKVGNLRCFNPKATNKVEKVKCRDGKDVAIGSTVRVGVSLADFEKLQTEQFGGWGSRLPELVDRTLTVQDISCKYQVETKSPACTIKVKHEDRHFWLNPMAVTTSLMTGSAGSGGHVEDLSRQHDLKVIPFEQIKLEKKLGSGAFGTVYLSKWSVTRCAVKQIAAQDIIEGPERDRILQEAVTHSRLIHPHIVQFIGISLQPTFMYIVLKCVDGFNLDEIIFERKMKLTDAEKTVIAGQVCDVIRYLHEDARPKVIHQDIKPSNVLVENGTKQALITDFGISRLAGHSPADTLSNVTKLYSTTLSGTVMYMAPELMKPNDHGLHRKPNFESDIFALGATLAEFFSGRRLYGDDVNDMTTLLNRKASSAPPFAVDHVPVPYRAVLRRSLASEPGGRPTAGQLVQAFS
ncbi:putative Serine/threonine-protein kinase Nek6 [Hypsibius exemplaris]|uniref:Serine/threonine-protein kinase Nek6 n=1 Tax=Hypsibius exemplaris TaxID=2072580 RepID=A0A1W0X3Z2_HYPEX|nr:putative Serine/threonine-protein kinase Nek6 [Hypsibius exemplaris]